MPIQWARYDEWFSWKEKTNQLPMSESERKDIEDTIYNFLKLDMQDRGTFWSEASPPGRYAATVLHIRNDVHHCYHQYAAESGLGDLGIKIFKHTPDAMREAKRMIQFHRGILKQMPGFTKAHAQRSLTAEEVPIQNGKSLLFSMDLEFQEDLDNRNSSERLRRQFEDNNIQLSQNVIIGIEEEPSRWVVNDAVLIFTRSIHTFSSLSLGNSLSPDHIFFNASSFVATLTTSNPASRHFRILLTSRQF